MKSVYDIGGMPKGAVEAGELDTQLEQVSGAVAAAFKH
jgi:hypothetical protein